MTAEQAIKREILSQICRQWPEKYPKLNATTLAPGNVIDAAYAEMRDGDGCDAIIDAESDFRLSGYQTDLPCEYSRHYESDSMATKLTDGSWVGWTRWYGGGKHGDPGAIDWMEDAYFLDVTEEEKMVTVRTWKKN